LLIITTMGFPSGSNVTGKENSDNKQLLFSAFRAFDTNRDGRVTSHDLLRLYSGFVSESDAVSFSAKN